MTVGIYRSPQNFIHEALLIGRLVEVNALFPSCGRKVIDETMSKPHESMARDRAEEFRRSAMLTEELKSREAETRCETSDRRLTVHKEKKLALFECLVLDAGH